MAVIKIKDLGAPGSMLFSDSESYLNELTEDELGISGGLAKQRNFLSITLTLTITITISITI
jgi:hypothetical protein